MSRNPDNTKVEDLSEDKQKGLERFGGRTAFRQQIKDAANIAQLKKAMVKGFKMLGLFDANEDEN